MFWCFLWIGCFFSTFQRGLAQGSSSNTDPGGGKSPPLQIAVKLGTDVILPCDAVGPNQPSQLLEWRKNGSKSAIFIKFMNFKPHIDSRYARRLHMINSSAILLSGAKESDSGIYRCKTMETNSETTVLKHGRWIVLKVTGKAALPSRRKTVVEKYPAVLDCLIDTNLPSENVVYSWTKNGEDASSDARTTIIASGALFIKSTRRTDSGVYICTAKTFDSNGLVTYPGTDIMLDVQFAPTITNMPDTVAVSEGSDAQLPCVSVGNPSTLFTNWTRHGANLTSHPRFPVLEKGSLLIKKVRRTDAGEYTCTPHNKVGAGVSKTTKLVLKVGPKFIVAPPSIMTLRVGDDVTLVCEAMSESPPTLTWEREEVPFPTGRTIIKNGKLAITAIQRDDYGVYTCIATSDDGQAKHSTTIAVISTPSKPTITSIHFNRATAVVKWRPGYDGGYPQQLEVWHRLVTDNDYEWHRSPLLPASVTSYNVPGLQPEQSYYFSIRGINIEGAGRFSDIVKAKGVPPVFNRSPDKADKPLAPQNVIVNITKDGYYITWTHTAVPGRPEVEKFVVEYTEGKDSNTWLVADAAVPAERKVYLFEAEMIEADKMYDFRVFAFGANELSDAAYVSKTYKIGSPVIGQPSGKSDVIPIIAGVLGAIVGIFLLGLVCFCFIHKKSGRANISKSGDKKVHFTLPDGTTEAYEPEESDEDFLDAEIKLRPEAVRFIPDDSDGSEDEKFAKLKREEDLLLTGHDGRYGGDMLRYAKLLANPSPPRSRENSTEDEKVHFFRDLESRDGQSAWYDCTLSKPASREVRDSYDQFCKSDIGSRDSILSHKSPPAFGHKASIEQLGTKAYVVPKFGSNHSLPDKRDSSLLRNPRFQPIQEEVPRDRDVPRGNAALGRRQPHHWSTPAVFTRRQDSNNNSDGKGSDSDSGDSSSRGRRGRRHRPHSLYEGKLRPISEQDSDSKLRCTCDEEDESDEDLKYQAHKSREGSATLSLRRKVPDTESSYLHLERADSQRLSFTEQLKGWSEASLKGEPYDKHLKNKTPVPPLDTDSENSVSPALSMVSLSETESDREIARSLYDSQPNAIKNGSITRQSEAVALPRAVTNLRSVDSESSSDEQGRSGTRDRSRKPSPPVYKDKKPPSVTDLNLNPMERADSMDQLKICDPFFQERHRVSRSSSNASSGICSVLVSSSETNSIESPRESSSKRSSRSSDRTSSDRASSGYGSSRDSYDKPVRIKPADYSKAHAQMRLKGTRFSPVDDPYELDPSSSEMDDVETEGAAYNPQVFEDLMTLQKEMGVNLEGSDSSRESLKEMKKLSNSDLLRYSPNVSPTKYKVDQLSDAEKDQRCSKLMAEYKTNKKLQDVKASGSQVYRSWDL